MDERLDQLIDSARDSYRVPPEAPVEAMWAAIEAEMPTARATGAATRRTRWGVVGVAAAAALVLGVGVGRWTVRSAIPGGSDARVAAVDDGLPRQQDLAEPLQRSAANYFGETAALFRDVQARRDGAYGAQAATLLARTRLLLDSPAASDPRLRDLLEDLELVLAQIAVLQPDTANALHRNDLQVIRSALLARDLVPRVHTAVVSFATNDE